MNAERLFAHYERIADSLDAIAGFRCFILNLAVRGKLVAQDPSDEPVMELLGRIALEKAPETRKTKPSIELPSSIPDIALAPGWVITTLQSVCISITDGDHLPPPKTESGIPFLVIGNVRSQTIQFTGSRFVSLEYYKALDTIRRPRSGDLLYTLVGSYGIPVVVRDDQPFCVQRHIGILRPSKFIDVDFLARAMESRLVFEQATTCATGIAQKTVPLSGLRRLLIPLPPLAEQHRIAAKVEELMTLCDQLEATQAERETTRNRLAAASLARLNAPDPDPTTFQNHAAFPLENLTPLTTRPDQIKPLRQTILNLAVRGKLVEQDTKDESAEETLKKIRIERDDVVQRKYIRHEKPLDKIDANEPPFEIPHKWCWTRIGEVALFTQYGTSTKSISSEQGIPVLTMGNIQDGGVVFGKEKKIPDESAELPTLLLNKFDLLYNRTNSAELVGKTGIYLGEDNCRTFASYLIRIRLSQTSSSPRYVNLAMNAPVFRETQIAPLIKKQTGQANVNGTALKHMLLPLPPLAEQHRIVAQVDKLIALCDRLEESLATVGDIRGRLLDAVLHNTLLADANPRKEYAK